MSHISTSQLLDSFLSHPIDHIKIQLNHDLRSGTDLFVHFFNQKRDTMVLHCHRRNYTYFSVFYERHPKIEPATDTSILIDDLNGACILRLLEKLPLLLTNALIHYLFQIRNVEGTSLKEYELEQLDLEGGFKTLDYFAELSLIRTLEMTVETVEAPFSIIRTIQHNS
jgi:hypothetical protein